MDNIYCTPRKNNMEAKNNLIEKQKKNIWQTSIFGFHVHVPGLSIKLLTFNLIEKQKLDIKTIPKMRALIVNSLG